MPKMKKIAIVLVIVIIGSVGLFKAGVMVGAAGEAKPGSVNDPLITKSYLESYISSLGLSGDSKTSGYSKVVLKKGATLIGAEGTEIMLYSGSANAYAKNEKLVNLTMGEACDDGMTLGKFCVYMCPDKSAGFVAVSDVVVYIKGTYTSK
ncbi:MAG: hypothetical protein UF228_03765 [Lachnospiraceae bacterium]|jgi:hypothetical protein|nr:hypothetical protein [Lachnospiraceae bacterium]